MGCQLENMSMDYNFVSAIQPLSFPNPHRTVFKPRLPTILDPTLLLLFDSLFGLEGSTILQSALPFSQK